MSHGPSDSATLRTNVVRGIRWKALSQGTTQLSRVAVMLVLARLLTPREFGLAGMVLVFAGLIQLFADFGFSASIIQHKEITDDDRATAFWTNLGVGLALTGIGIGAAPYVARFYGEPELKPLLTALSLTFVVASLSSTQASLLTRDMRFRTLELAAMTASAAGAVAAIITAVMGGGPWALILQALVTAAVTSAYLSLSLRFVPRRGISRASLRKLWGFGASVFASRIFGYLGRDTDNFLIGRFLGAQALGIYSIAYTVIAMPFDRILAPVQALLQPMFARLQDDRERTRNAWLQGLRMCTALLAPLTFGVIVVAPDFVRVVLGARWLPSVHVLQVLAYVGSIQAAVVVSPLVFMSQYRTRLMLKISALSFAAHLCAFVVGLHWGVLGVAVGYSLSTTLVAVPLQLIVPGRLLHTSIRAVLSSQAGVAQATIGMTATVLAARLGLEHVGVGAAPRLAACALLGTVTYVLLAVWREPRLLHEFSVPGRLRAILLQPVAALESGATGDAIPNRAL